METVSVSFKKGDQPIASVPEAGGEVFVVFTEGGVLPQAISIPGLNEPFELNHISFAENTSEQLGNDTPTSHPEEVPSTGQHDIFFNDEHAKMPEDHQAGEEDSNWIGFNALYRPPSLHLPRTFGHPTSEWRPK